MKKNWCANQGKLGGACGTEYRVKNILRGVGRKHEAGKKLKRPHTMRLYT